MVVSYLFTRVLFCSNTLRRRLISSLYYVITICTSDLGKDSEKNNGHSSRILEEDAFEAVQRRCLSTPTLSKVSFLKV